MQPKFNAEEKVLCYHGPLLYEAKVLKHKKEGGVYAYFVHYQGWNKNWDEWVGEGRMLKQVSRRDPFLYSAKLAHCLQMFDTIFAGI